MTEPEPSTESFVQRAIKFIERMLNRTVVSAVRATVLPAALLKQFPEPYAVNLVTNKALMAIYLDANARTKHQGGGNTDSVVKSAVSCLNANPLFVARAVGIDIEFMHICELSETRVATARRRLLSEWNSHIVWG